MTPRRNRRAGVEDLWTKTVRDEAGNETRVPSKLHGQGMRWRARYVDDVSKEVTKRFRTKVAAQQWLDGVTSDHVTGVYIDPVRHATLFSVVAEAWIGTKSGLEPKTIAGYRSLLDTLVLPTWKDKQLRDITHEGIQDWITAMGKGGHRFTDKGLSASRIIQANQVMDQVLRYAIRSKRLAINPADDVELPRKVEPEKRFLTHEQLQALAAESDRFEVLVLVLGYCGLRIGEATALQAHQVDVKASRINVARSATYVTGKGILEGATKNHERRSVPVAKIVMKKLKKRVKDLEPTALVFPGRDGGYLPIGELRWVFDPAAKDAGVKGLTPHELRHTAASLAIAAGANIKVVQRMLGHKTATLTFDRYGHLYGDDLDAVATALDKAARKAAKSTAYSLRTEEEKGTTQDSG